MKNRYLFAVTFSLLTLLCTAAAAQKLEFTSEPGTDFTKYKTYKWQRADKAIYPEPDVDAMFIRTIEAEMAKKGFTRTESDDADVYLTYQIAVLDDIEWASSQTIIGWGGLASGGVYMGIPGAVLNSSNVIKKGSFIMDLFDVKAKRRIWQVRATKTLAQTTDIKKRENNTKKIMAKIFKNYPPVAR